MRVQRIESSRLRSLVQNVSLLALICASSHCLAAEAESSILPDILVQVPMERPFVPTQSSATGLAADGSAAAGYRVEDANLGPLGDRKILDTPYSITAIPLDLMQSQQASNIQDVIKYDPSAQIEPRGNMNFGRPQTRGFENASTQNTRIDGMNSYTIMAYPMEAFQTLEILNGAAGALYGASSPGGVFNFISKRPTATPFNELTVGYDGLGLFTEHAEFSGRAGDGGAFGYRINALHANGESYVGYSNIERQLLSGNFDLRLSDATRLELNAYTYVDNEEGLPNAFVYGANPGKGLAFAPVLTPNLPAAPDPSKVGYGVAGAGQTLSASTVNLRLIHQFSPDWKLTLGGLWQNVARTENPTGTYGAANPGNWLTNAAGAYSTILGDTGLHQNVTSAIANLNGKVQTGWLTHDLMLGANAYQQIGQTRIGQNYLLGTASIADPVLFYAPDYENRGSFYKSAYSGQQVLVNGDTITFNEHWSAIAAASETWLTSRSFNPAGAATADYNAFGVSPTFSLIYKPLANVTTYFTYADALQQGDTAPTSTGITNSGQVLAPYRSKEWEVGAKWTLIENFETDVAAFRMTRPYAFTNTATATFEEAGQQINDGVELMGRGRLFNCLNLVGGVTYLDPTLQNTGNPTTSDKLVVSVPRWQANLFAEYFAPAVAGLSFNANLHYASQRAADMTNTTWAAAYATLDLGTRYETQLAGHKLTLRLGVGNVTNAHYWAAILPETVSGGSSQAGAASSVYAAFLGAPRVIHASMTAAF